MALARGGVDEGPQPVVLDGRDVLGLFSAVAGPIAAAVDDWGSLDIAHVSDGVVTIHRGSPEEGRERATLDESHHLVGAPTFAHHRPTSSLPLITRSAGGHVHVTAQGAPPERTDGSWTEAPTTGTSSTPPLVAGPRPRRPARGCAGP